MKKIYLSLFTILGLATITIAQPTITSTNFTPSIGDSQLYNVADTNSVLDNTTGANVTFNYTGLAGYGQSQTQHIVDPATTFYASDFPGATTADTTDGSAINTNYSQLFSTDSITKSGIVANVTTYGTVVVKYNQDPEITMKFPFNYGDNYTDNYAGLFTIVAYGQTTNGSGTTTVDADAWGTLDLPFGVSIDSVLRVKTTENLVTDTIVIPLPPITILPVVISAEYINYYKPSISKYPLLSFINGTYTQDNNTLDSSRVIISQYPIASLTSIEEKASEINVELFPNPSNNGLTTLSFELENSTAVTIEILNAVGQSVKQLFSGNLAQGENNLKIKTSDLSKGLYFVNINIDNKITTTKLLIE